MGSQKLPRRGKRQTYAGSDVHEYDYRRQFQETFADYSVAGRVRVEYKSDLDHQFTSSADQQEFIRELVAWTASLG